MFDKAEPVLITCDSFVSNDLTFTLLNKVPKFIPVPKVCNVHKDVIWGVKDF